MAAARDLVIASLLFSSLALGGCQSAEPTERAFLSRDAVTRAQAAVQTARDGNPGEARAAALVSLLGDRDAGVRMYAILSLRRLYRDDLGYRYYDPEPLRAAAIDRWRAALHDGTIKPIAAASAATQPAEPAPAPVDPRSPS
jgi:hypothetical protein